MMARMLSQLPLPLRPAGAAEIAAGVGLLAGEDGGLVAVHGLAAFAWDAGDEAGRRLAAVQLVRLRAASQGQVAEAFGVDPATIWRWDQALACGGVAGLVPVRRGPKGASKLTPALAARIAGLDAAGQTLRQIAAATGVSTFTVRAALGRVPVLDRAPEVKTIRRKLGELAAAGKAGDLIMALARRHAAARPQALGFLYVDGHARAYYGTRTVQKMHIARLKSPAPATEETWVTSQQGDPVFMVVAEPSESLAGELRRLLPGLPAIVGEGRRVTVCFDRGGWSPALFADITGAGFDLLTWRKGPAPDLPAGEFTTITCADDRGREHRYDLADTTVALGIHDGPRKGQTVSLRQVTRRVPARHGGTRQIHALTSRSTPGRRRSLLAADLTMAGRELLPLRPHPLRPGRPGLPRRRPGRPRPAGPQPGQENRRRPGPPRRGPRRRGPGPARR